MINLNLYHDYLNGSHLNVWETISFLEYDELNEVEKVVVVKIIEEIISRIDQNITITLKILQEHGFYYTNFGNINPFNRSYLVRRPEEYSQLVQEFTNVHSNTRVPIFLSFFSAFFTVIDFRGLFGPFEVKILLDALFIESPNNLDDVEDRKFERVYKDETVMGYLFSPDAFIKEDVSGNLGPCILLKEKAVIDDFVINYSDDMSLTFVEYLRFCFHWSCFPNLFWASGEERQPFLPILKKVRESIKQF